MSSKNQYLRLTGLFIFLIVLIILIVCFLQLFIQSTNQLLSEGIYAHYLLNTFSNPFFAILGGVVFSVLVGSSSIIITLLAAIVMAGFPFTSAIFMLLGANIGTTFHSSLSQVIPDAQVDDKRRMMTISSMHYFNNVIAFALFFPLQISTDFLGRSSQYMAQWFDGLISERALDMSALIQPLTESLPITNHPILMIFLFIVLIIFFMRVFFIILRLIFDPLVIKILTQQIKHEKMQKRVLLDGIFISSLLQSSSSTIYILMPLVRKITCNIPLIYSLILGINVGTCFTTILFALLLQSEIALSIGLAHLFYNVFALLIFTYIPLLKELPILASRYLSVCSYGYDK